MVILRDEEMKNNDFFFKIKEQKKKLCSACDYHYSKKEPLIFPNYDQKIVLITESPYNYPTDKIKKTKDFIEKTFLKKINNSAKNLTEESIFKAPKNVFDFILKTFRPLFKSVTKIKSKSPICLEEIYNFFMKIYWTHAAKKTPIINGGKLRNAYLLCKPTFHVELLEFQPRLIIIASSIALKAIFHNRVKYTKLFEKQLKKIREEKLPIITDYKLENKKLEEKFSNSKVVIFPNPSPVNGYWKKKAYENRKMVFALKEIHRIIRKNSAEL
jgi:hypothetical protein